MEAKYTLTDKTKKVGKHTLYQIKAVRDVGMFKSGTLGGYIASEKNLSHEGDCWIANTACVYEEAVVSGEAFVSGNARIYGRASISGDAIISDKVTVCDDAAVLGAAKVFDNARVSGRAVVTIDIDYDCDFKVEKVFRNLLAHKDRICLLGMDPDLDKILEQLLKRKE